MIRIALADDQPELVEGLKLILQSDSDLKVVGCAENGEELLALLQNTPADVVLMDVRMPKMNGVLATREVCSRYPATKVVLLTTFNDSEYILGALNYGACGYLLKDVSAEDLIASVKRAVAGDMILPSRVAKTLVEVANTVKSDREIRLKRAFALSDREIEIALMVLDGFNNHQIATALFISEGTCRNYVSAIYEKIGAENRKTALEIIEKALK